MRKTCRVDNEKRRVVRAAFVSGDGALVVATLADADFDRCAQQVGDALLSAIEHNADGARQLAQRCVVVLRARCWDGDDELAAQLDAGLDLRAESPALAALRVDLDDVADILDSSNGDGGWINIATGDTWSRDMLDSYDEFDNDRPGFDDSDLWLAVPATSSRFAYRDMEHFIDGIVDIHLADRLAEAIHGQGAFRRFRSVVQTSPDTEDDWHGFSNERRRGRSRSWLARVGYRPEQRFYRPDC